MKPLQSLLIIFHLFALIASLNTIVDGSEDEDLITRYERATKKSLLWGAYRPNAYIGIRPKLPRSLISGLFWFNADKIENIRNIRHYCDQNLDFKGFGWERYDPRFGGSQFFKDNEIGFTITTDFIKNDDGNWALRVKGLPKPGFENKSTSIVFYTGLEGDDGALTSVKGSPLVGFNPGEDVRLIGKSDELGDFVLDINDGPITNNHKKLERLVDPSLDPSRTHHVSLRVPNDNTWKASEIFTVLIQESLKNLSQGETPDYDPDPSSLLTVRNLQKFEGNSHIVQKIFTGAFEFDILFNVEDSQNQISSTDIPNLLNDTITKIDEKFNKAFNIQPPFNTDKYLTFAKETFSNLLGGIGYYYGDQLVDRETELNEENFESIKLSGESEGPLELFSASPSRTFFPRGFYWDEGFHLIPIVDYDFDLVLEILKSWFNLIDEDGWIAREQILGPEARSKVPKEFQVQSPNIANPPTLMLIFVDLLKKAKLAKEGTNTDSFGDIDEPNLVENFANVDFSGISDAHLKFPELMISYAEEIYDKLKLHYEWFRRTQKGELEEFEREPYSPSEAYRWRGRTFTHNLACGLDDYPRAPVPDVAELNVDLISWIGIMTRSMKEIAELLNKNDDFIKYSKIEKDIQRNIDDLHWSEKEQVYCDVSVDSHDDDVFICHKGYISLFPFLLEQIEPGNEHLKPLIELIANPDELWTEFGIRSLSKTSEFYKKGDDYWTSPIWYPINYLILKALRFYGTGENGSKLDADTLKLVKNIYTQLRINLVENCYKNWVETGYLFEQYNDENGSPKGAKHFTGWTSLVTIIMGYPEKLD